MNLNYNKISEQKKSSERSNRCCSNSIYLMMRCSEFFFFKIVSTLFSSFYLYIVEQLYKIKTINQKKKF